MVNENIHFCAYANPISVKIPLGEIEFEDYSSFLEVDVSVEKEFQVITITPLIDLKGTKHVISFNRKNCSKHVLYGNCYFVNPLTNIIEAILVGHSEFDNQTLKPVYGSIFEKGFFNYDILGMPALPSIKKTIKFGGNKN